MSIDTTGLLVREDVKAFFLSDEAIAAFAAMFDHTRAVAGHYGTDSPEFAAEVDSLARCLAAILGRPGFGRRMHITRDGDLSLYCNEDGAFVFGMIFHGDRDKDGAAVVPGTWSLHS